MADKPASISLGTAVFGGALLAAGVYFFTRPSPATTPATPLPSYPVIGPSIPIGPVPVVPPATVPTDTRPPWTYMDVQNPADVALVMTATAPPEALQRVATVAQKQLRVFGSGVDVTGAFDAPTMNALETFVTARGATVANVFQKVLFVENAYRAAKGLPAFVAAAPVPAYLA